MAFPLKRTRRNQQISLHPRKSCLAKREFRPPARHACSPVHAHQGCKGRPQRWTARRAVPAAAAAHERDVVTLLHDRVAGFINPLFVMFRERSSLLEALGTPHLGASRCDEDEISEDMVILDFTLSSNSFCREIRDFITCQIAFLVRYYKHYL